MVEYEGRRIEQAVNKYDDDGNVKSYRFYDRGRTFDLDDLVAWVQYLAEQGDGDRVTIRNAGARSGRYLEVDAALVL